MSERVRWGILGTANIALRRFIPGARASRNGEVVAIASRDGARASEAAAQLGIARSFASYEDLLADPGVDALYIPLPNSMHAEWTIKALAAGKHVLCEKPLALDVREARSMIDAAREHDRVLMEAFMYRFHPQQTRVREILDAGEIGEVRFVRAGFTFSLEPLDAKNVRLQRALGGGALMDVGCYCVNAARMLFAEEPLWASAQWDFRDEYGVEVSLAGVLGFSGDRTAIFDCGFRAAAPSFYHVGGSKGTLYCANAFTPPSTDDVTLSITPGAERREERLPGVDQYRLEAEEFADALLRERPLRIPPEDALGTLRAIEALHASARAGGARIAIGASLR